MNLVTIEEQRDGDHGKITWQVFIGDWMIGEYDLIAEAETVAWNVNFEISHAIKKQLNEMGLKL